MNRVHFSFLLLLPLVLLSPGKSFPSDNRAHHSPSDTSGREGAFVTRQYHDFFVALLGTDESSVERRVGETFDRLFFGDEKTQRVYYDDPSDSSMAYIEDIANADVRTEGMSYGMMFAVQMDRKDVFDKLWRWAKKYMQFRSGPHRGYFAWHCRPDGTVLDSTAASDGEEWFVMSLFFASARWGDGAGMYDYRAEADNILNTMLHKEEEPDHGRVTDMFNKETHLVAFVPSAGGDSFTDPSYMLPHYYELWGRWAGKDNQFWLDAASKSREFLKKAADPTTGLFPDYAEYDGKPKDVWRGGHSDFRFDAWRVAMNISMDHLWFSKDDWEIAECNRLLDFFHSQGVTEYGNQYTLDGKRLASDHSPGLVGMNAVAAVTSSSPYRKAFVEQLWNTPVPAGKYRYYDGLLYMMAVLQVSGNFRIYYPDNKKIQEDRE